MKKPRTLQLACSILTLLVAAPAAQAYDAVLDVYLAYSTNKKNREGGTNALRSKILTSQGIFNKANRDSTVNLRVNFVGFDEINYSKGSKTDSQILNDVRTNAFGNLHQRRNQWGADKIAFIADLKGCGIGYRPGDYSVTDCLGQHTLAHEVGHNFGCGHGAGNGGGDKPYAEGYVFTGNDGKRYKTIMVGNYDRDAKMTYRWSSFALRFAGKPVGESFGRANNRRRIREVMKGHTARRQLKPQSFPNARWTLVNRFSEKVVENPYARTNNGNKLKQYTYGGQPHMEWKFQDAGQGGGWFVIENAQSGKCMDMTGRVGNGVDYHQWSKNLGNQNQHFKLDASGDGYVRIRARRGGKVVHNHERSRDNGARVTQWGWNGATHMQYEVRYQP